MKGKLLNIAISTFVCLAMVLGLVAAFAPAVAFAEPGIDKIASIDEPNQGKYNVAIETDIVALAQAVDGTLFAGVQDTSVFADARWTITVNPTLGNQPREYAVFYSSNGYDWTQGFIIPWDDNTEIVEIMPVPDYSATNAIVYMATQYFVYISRNGGQTFTRTNQNVPGILSDGTGGVITSIDVAKNCDNSGVSCATCGYVCVVGTADGSENGVYTWNEDGFASWRDKEIGNAPAADNSWDIYDVRLNPRWNQDAERVIIAAAFDDTNTILTVRGTLGTWSVEALDALICAGPVTGARVDFADDYHWVSNPRSFVAIWGGGDADAYRVTSIQSPGAPAVKRLNVDGGTDIDVFDIAVIGSGSTCTGLVAIEDPVDADQLQVFRSENIAQFSPTWQPSHKPPVGGTGNVQLVWTTFGAYVGGDDGTSTSGVSKMAQDATGKSLGTNGWAWNGIGLIDTIIVSGDYVGDWVDCKAGAIWTEASPGYAGDKTVFMITNDYGYSAAGSTDTGDTFVWRTGNAGDTWELILMSELDMPEDTLLTGVAGQWDLVTQQVLDPDDEWMSGFTWSLRTAPGFSNVAGGDQTLFMLANRYTGDGDSSQNQWVFKSTDAGNTWKRLIAMPDFVEDGYFAHTAWVVVDDNTVIFADDDAYVYETHSNGYQWSYGATTADEGSATNLKFYKDGTSLVVLAGIWDWTDYAAEVWISFNGGLTFQPVGASLIYAECDTIGISMVDFDQNYSTNHTIYAAAGAKLDVWTFDDSAADLNWKLDETYDAGFWRAEVKLEDPESSLWDEIVTTEDIFATMPEVDQSLSETYADIDRFFYPTALEVGADNTIYIPFVFVTSVQNDGYPRNTYGGFIRCLDGTVYPDEWKFIVDGMPRYGGLWLGSTAPGSTYLFSIDTRYDAWGTIESSNTPLIDLRLVGYKDTLSGAGPAPVAPLDGASGFGVLLSDTSVKVTLSWEAKGGASKYAWEVSEDAAFSNPIEGETSALSVTVLDLKAATDYYWHSRSIEPGASRWSATQKFTTLMGGETGAPSLRTPEIGSTITDTTPTFTWTKVASATNYQLQVATDPGFGAADIVIEEELGNVQGFVVKSADKLENGDYFWHVKGTNPTNDTDTGWSEQGSFTLDTGAGGTGTPVWVWVLIVLGVLLGIVVLVLILRTRRPV